MTAHASACRLCFIVARRTRFQIHPGEVAVPFTPVDERVVRWKYPARLMAGHAEILEFMTRGAFFILAVEREWMTIYETVTMWDADQIVTAMAHVAILLLHMALRAHRGVIAGNGGMLALPFGYLMALRQ